MTTKNYVRMDLWRYVSIEDPNIRATFRFTKFAVNYVYVLLLICFIIRTLAFNVTGTINIPANILLGVLIVFWVKNNTLGDISLYFSRLIWEFEYQPDDNEHLDLYYTRGAIRHTKFRIYLLYWIIFFAVFVYLIYNAIGSKYLVSKGNTIIFFLLYYFFCGWACTKHVIRRINLKFGE